MLREERTSFKLNIKKSYDLGIWHHYFMAIEGEKVEVVTDFLFLGSKITADGDHSHEIIDVCFLAGKR